MPRPSKLAPSQSLGGRAEAGGDLRVHGDEHRLAAFLTHGDAGLEGIGRSSPMKRGFLLWEEGWGGVVVCVFHGNSGWFLLCLGRGVG